MPSPDVRNSDRPAGVVCDITDHQLQVRHHAVLNGFQVVAPHELASEQLVCRRVRRNSLDLRQQRRGVPLDLLDVCDVVRAA